MIGVPVHWLSESSQRAHVTTRLEVSLQFYMTCSGCPTPLCRVTMCFV